MKDADSRPLTDQAEEIISRFYGIAGTCQLLPGELDYNFKVSCADKSLLLKISRPEADKDSIEFQNAILHAVRNSSMVDTVPELLSNKAGENQTVYTDSAKQRHLVRLLTWIDGRLWSAVNPHTPELLESLGAEAGKITNALTGFDHPFAHRKFEWDVAQYNWVKDYVSVFSSEEKELAEYFIDFFEPKMSGYAQLRKSVVHNDANDNNVIVTDDISHPTVRAIIDYGDAIYTQVINDVAIAIAYAAMDKPDPLAAACKVLQGYHKSFALLEEELEYLYALVALRLLISVTKSARNKIAEPENEYLLISEQPAWELLKKWQTLDPNFAHFSFRNACGLSAHKNFEIFKTWASRQKISFQKMFPEHDFTEVLAPDLSVGSLWLGHEAEYNDLTLFSHKLNEWRNKNPNCLIVGGYLEPRAVYSASSYKVASNEGPQYRTMHLGVDFWLPESTRVQAILPGKVYGVADNDADKDYGGTIILKHQFEGHSFYSLYGHLSKASLTMHKEGDEIKIGDVVGYLGAPTENGGWAPHLHYQLMLDMLGNTSDFPGAAVYSAKEIWASICPDPGWLFEKKIPAFGQEEVDLLGYRKEHLGKSLSLSYEQPLTILRGSGAWLIDYSGRRYLDTVNNVAHVGHEHPDVVRAGQQQMAVLNTNTRYLHPTINAFAEQLLETFPPALSVVHFVNSGSEANELALRMAKAVTSEKDMIAMEVGYHGNTNACIAVSSYKFDGQGGSGAPAHTHIVPLPDVFRGRYRDESAGSKYALHVKEQVEKVQAQGRKIAGFICESIISCGGQIELPTGFLKEAYAFVRAAGGVCIADEVQVGCGRVGSHFWGFELHDVTPDIVTIGKPIGNGHPLAAVVCTPEIAEAFANGMEYFNTFGGNPVSCAIGTEVLRVIKRENMQENALQTGNYLISGLKNLQKAFPLIGDVRGKGLFLGFELTDSSLQPLPEKASYLVNRMRALGVLMSIDGPDHNVLKIKPPMVFSRSNADEMLIRLEQVFKEDFMQVS